MKPFYITKLYFSFLLLTFVHLLTAQSCLNDFRYITRQSELDSIAILNPECKEITGFMIIDGPGIVSLEPFKQFTKVDVIQFVNCVNLTSFAGFDSVRNAVSIIIEKSGLTSLDGFSGIDSIVGFTINNNSFLKELEVPENLTYVASLRITNNKALETISGSSSLPSMGSLIISSNDSLEQILDFADIHVGVSINITDNPRLINIQGLNKVKSIGDNLFINNNASLKYLPNFDSLSTIGGNFLLEGIDPPQGPRKDSILQNIPTCPILKSIGGNIRISGLHGIKEITGFENLRSVGSFLIGGGIGLTKINAFKSLEKVTGVFNLVSNPNLISVIGFNILQETQRLNISNNNKLVSLAGFGSLQKVESFSFSTQVALQSLNNFKNLKTVEGEFFLEANGALEEVDFSSLERIGTPDKEIRVNLSTNRKLKSLSTFKNLKEVYGTLIVSDMWALNSLDGLENIDYKNLKDVRLQNNLNLFTGCAVQSICDYILLGEKTFEAINTNGTGCNTLEEIKAQCLVSTSDLPRHHDLVTLYPNPASQHIQVTSESQKTITNIHISTVDGMVLDLGMEIDGNQVDISSLIAGLYVLSCQVGGIVVQKPFIKVK